jgi:hypothetical protein
MRSIQYEYVARTSIWSKINRVISVSSAFLLFWVLANVVQCADTTGALASRRLAAVPNLQHQVQEEAEYLKLHKCRDVMEAYSASYLITREHLTYQFTGLNLTWVNCEM